MKDHTSPPFTPPPYYVPWKDLPRKKTTAESSLSRAPTVSRQLSSRRSPLEADVRVQKSSRQPKKKPGLSINTNVTRHRGNKPEEVKNTRIARAAGESSILFAPPPNSGNTISVPITAEATPSIYSVHSPSRFPASYLDASNRQTLRASPGSKDLYFEPPPHSRSNSIASIVVRQNRRNPPKNELVQKASLRRQSMHSISHSISRGSTYTAFEEDYPSQERVVSSDTVFEEDMSTTMSSRLVPESANTITPHRSTGWWSVITTPFENKSPSHMFRPEGDEGETPAVPSIPERYTNASQMSKTAPHESMASQASNSFSPNDREIPIALDPNHTVQSSPVTTQAGSTLPTPAPTSAGTRRMPFTDSGMTPMSGQTEFSSAGIVSSEGNVGAAPAVVNQAIAVPLAHAVQPQQFPVPEAARAKAAAQLPQAVTAENMGHQARPQLAQTQVYVASGHATPERQIIQPQVVVVDGIRRAQHVTPERQVNITIERRNPTPEHHTNVAFDRRSFTPERHAPQPPVFVADGRRGAYPQREFQSPRINAVRFTSPRSSMAEPGSARSPMSTRSPMSPFPTYSMQPARAIRAPRYESPPSHWRDPSWDYEDLDVDDKPLKPAQKENAWGMYWDTFLNRLKYGKAEKKEEKQKEKKKKSKTRKCCCCCCLCLVIFFLILVILAIVLPVVLTRKHKSATSVQYQNVTNFPLIPIGPLTIARPNLVASQSGCVAPSTVWSCALPKEQQTNIAPNDPDQPNFIFNIAYDSSEGTLKRRSASGPVIAGNIFKRRVELIKRMLTPLPSPPTDDDQTFLGNTTDGSAIPFEGEQTPFYITVSEPTTPGTTKLKAKRDVGSPTSTLGSSPVNTANVIPNVAVAIPTPPLNPDGTPPPATLLPAPTNQPVRFYNRGLPDEHYGFYTYFDRSIFLRSNLITNASNAQADPADANGGSPAVDANVRCTWSDTRFLVQIWTRRPKTSLLAAASSGSNEAGGNFNRPGSFPYPVTITLDRHGGGLNTKMLYCFGMELNGKLNVTNPQFQGEDRAFNGSIINPSTGPFKTPPLVSIAAGGPGGIDGGTGGCSCKWQNWS
jgi:hypothetical protein